MNFDHCALLKAAIARSLGGTTVHEQANFARARFGLEVADIVARSGVAAVGRDDLLGGAQVAAEAAVFDRLVDATIRGRLTGKRVVPASRNYRSADDAATAAWVAEGSSIPISRANFSRHVLLPKRVASLMVVNEEVLAADSGELLLLQRDMEAGLALADDAAFLDPSNHGDGATPAAVTADAPSLDSTGDPETDFEALATIFTGNWSNAVVVLHPLLAVSLARQLKGTGLADLGPRGGTYFGIPALTSRGVPETSDGHLLALIDGSGIAETDDGIEARISTEGVVRMDSAPAGSTITPTGESAAVSLFQCDARAVRLIRRCCWANGREGGVVTVRNVTYGASSA